MEDSFICLKSMDKQYSIYDAYDDSEIIYYIFTILYQITICSLWGTYREYSAKSAAPRQSFTVSFSSLISCLAHNFTV